MAKEYRGDADGHGLRIGVVVARFNPLITSRLLEGAKEALLGQGVRDEDIDIAWVPGSFEIPLAAQKMGESGRYAAIVCLGAVIRGGTDHYEHIATQAAGGIASAALKTGVPMAFGVLTTENLQQALDRAGGKEGNKGYDAAMAALNMAGLLKQLKGD